MLIRRPLSPGGGWIEVSLYRAYADLAREQLNAHHYFDAIVLTCVGYDVLVNTLPDRIRVHYFEKLTPAQQRAIGKIEVGVRLTAGNLLDEMKKANILHWRLDRALRRFNQLRNNVIHPIERREKIEVNGNTSYFLSLKRGAVVPYKVTKEDAETYFRYFCHIIDLSGGESPFKCDKASKRYSLSRILDEVEDERRLK